MLRERLKRILREAASLDAGADFSLDAPPKAEYGDYASNLPLGLAKALGKNPMSVAEELAAKIFDSAIAKITIAPPGFLNITISDDVLASKLERILANPHTYGNSTEGGGKTVVVEYFQLNTAKPAHIGHLRSAVIGDALKRLLIVFGYNVVADTHVGDWGTQFGILLYAYKNFGDKTVVEKDPLAELNKLYVLMSQKIEEDLNLREAAKAEFAKLETGDPENRKLWEWMSRVSMEKLEDAAKTLGLLPFEEHKAESTYEEAMPPIVAEALEKNIAVKKDDGAVAADLSGENLDEAVLVKSDGATTYLLRDLATIKHRINHWKSVKNFYVVDNRQSFHFRQVFRLAELLGWGGVENIHVATGFMKLPEGAMSTRKGNVILLDEIIALAKKRASEIIQEKNPELANKNEVAHAIAIGALKYFDLSHHRESDIVFRAEEAVSFEGDTGPYLQYTHARLASILRKHGDLELKNFAIRGDAVERELLAHLIRLPDVIEDAVVASGPHMLAQYLFHLAKLANNFYHACPVLTETDEAVKHFRLLLVAATAAVLQRGLYILGIEAPSEM